MVALFVWDALSVAAVALYFALIGGGMYEIGRLQKEQYSLQSQLYKLEFKTSQNTNDE